MSPQLCTITIPSLHFRATNPSQFRIEFFVNDLSKAPGAAVFEALGALDYNQNGNIRMELSHRVSVSNKSVLTF